MLLLSAGCLIGIGVPEASQLNNGCFIPKANHISDVA